MNREKLVENLEIFTSQMDERMKDLSPKERQQYLEGLVHAFDSITRYAGLHELTPMQQMNFIGSAKSWAYSKTGHLRLDTKTYMQPLIESDSQAVAKTYKIAATLQTALRIPLDMEDEHNLSNVLMVATF